jgi:hypothetical protein
MLIKDEQVKQPGHFSQLKMTGIYWVLEHSKELLYALGILAIVLFLSVFLIKRFHTPAQKDYAQASHLFQEIVSSLQANEKSLESLEKLTKTHSELNARFGGWLAQQFLSQGKLASAEFFATSAIKRTQEQSPYYARFAATTLTIEKEGFAAALNEAKALKKALDEDTAFFNTSDQAIHKGSVLYVFNLLRIAMLEKETGSLQAELAAWEELLHPKPLHLHATAQLLEHFRDDDTSLLDYINHRKAAL